MLVLLAVPFAISTFMLISPVHRFLLRIMERYISIPQESVETVNTITQATPQINPRNGIHSLSLLLIAISLSLLTVTALALTVIPTGLAGLWLLPLILAANFTPFLFRGLSAVTPTTHPPRSITDRITAAVSLAVVSSILSLIASIPASFVCVFSTIFKPFQTIKLLLSAPASVAQLTFLIIDKALLKIRSYFNINAKQILGGDTSLIAAAHSGNESAITSLLQKGAQVNLQNKQGNTALHLVIASSNIPLNKKTAIINALLTAGANIQIVNSAGQNPISMLNGLTNQADRTALIQLFQGRNIVVPADVLTRPVRQRFNNPQSYNTLSVRKSANKSLKALQRHYSGINVENTLSTIQAEFEKQAKTFTTSEEKKWIAPARTALNKIINNKVSYTERFDDGTSIDLRSALAYIWMGVCDKQAMKKSTLSDAEIINRKKQFIQHLYECQRGYNLNDIGVDNGAKDDRPICGHGHSVKMLSVLWNEHDDVTLAFVTPESLSLKAKQLIYEKFKALDKAVQDQHLPTWEEDASIPDELFAILKPQITAALHEEFDQYAEFINDSRNTGYEAILQGTIDSTQYLPPATPPAAVAPTPQPREVIGALRNINTTPILDAMLGRSHSAATQPPVAPQSPEAENLNRTARVGA